MEKKQTQVTDTNRSEFYRTLYPLSAYSVDQLIDLTKYNQPCILIDCAGRHYQTQFPQNKIYSIETITSATQFKFGAGDFDRLVDNRVDDAIIWPRLDLVNPVLVFDHSPLLKYLKLPVFIEFIDSAIQQYKPNQVIIRNSLTFIDDSRTQDRFYNLAQFKFTGYVVTKFVYDAECSNLELSLKRIVHCE